MTTDMINLLKKYQSIMLICLLSLLSACSSIPYSGGISDNTQSIMAQKELSNDELLDVSILLFESGTLPSDEEKRKGLSEKIRNSEARFIPVHLKYTLQRTGYWGNVRVIPTKSEGSEVLIKGKILQSDGESLKLEITVFDASNKQWFKKNYHKIIRYDDRTQTEIERKDVFQDVYNKISNDIIEYRQKLTLKDLKKIKNISTIRFLGYMSPDVYSDYINKDKKGEYQLNKLPSLDDPMMKRIQNIKFRDAMMVDTVNNYYDLYYSDMWESYDNWRKFRSEEMDTIRDIETKALTQKIVGVAAIVGAIALGASSNSDIRETTGVLRTVMVAGGSYALYKGFQTSKESEINKEAIEELGESFTTEVEPMLVNVDGKTMKLTGTADQQYSKWKNILKEIYKNETGYIE